MEGPPLPEYYTNIRDLLLYSQDLSQKLQKSVRAWPSFFEPHWSREELYLCLHSLKIILEEAKFAESVHFTRITEILADATRNPKWRKEFGQKHILAFYVELLRVPPNASPLFRLKWREAWVIHGLRLINNCCADNNHNRQLVLDGDLDLEALSDELSRIDERDEHNVAMNVMYSLCRDFEQAQMALSKKGLYRKILTHFPWNTTKDPYSYEYFDQMCMLINWTNADDTETEPYQGEDAVKIAHFITHHHLENPDLPILLAVFLDIMRKHPPQKDLMINIKNTRIIERLFLQIPNRSPVSSNTGSSVNSAIESPQELDEEHTKAGGIGGFGYASLGSRRMDPDFFDVLWELISHPRFPSVFPPKSNLVRGLISWVIYQDVFWEFHACILFRAYISNHDIALQLCSDLRLHVPLTRILQNSRDELVLHEVLRVLKNYILPIENRQHPEIANTDIISRVAILVEHESNIVKLSAIQLLNLLITGCPDSVALLLADFQSEVCPLLRIVRLFKRLTEKSLRVEVGKTVVAAWRTMSRFSGATGMPNTTSPAVAEFAAVVESWGRVGPPAVDIVRPVIGMITEAENPSIVTEGWFGLNLIAEKRSAGRAVYIALAEGDGMERMELVISEYSSRVISSTGRPDAENVKALAMKLVEHDAGTPEWRRDFKDKMRRSGMFQINFGFDLSWERGST